MTSPAERLAQDLEMRKRPEVERPPSELMKQRLAYKLTGAAVAREVRIDASMLHKLERGICSCSVGLALRLAKFYGTTVEALFSEET